MLKFDRWLVDRVFTPIAHWVDYRFHLNPYAQAFLMIVISMMMVGIGSLWHAIIDHQYVFYGLFFIFMENVLWASAARFWRMSKALERSGNVLPAEAIAYHADIFRMIRLPLFIFSFTIAASTNIIVSEALILKMCEYWFFFNMLSVYFAAISRPTKRRYEPKLQTSALPDPSAA